MDVENIDALNPAELDALLERALDPQVPVEVFYAVLERIGSQEPSAGASPAYPGAEAAGQAWPARPSQPAQVPSSPAQPANGMHATSALPPAVQPLSLTLPSQGSQTSAQYAHPQASQGTKTAGANQQSNVQSGSAPQPAPAGRRAAQHGPPPRGFAVPAAETEATILMRPIADTDAAARSGSAAATPPPDTAVSTTAQTTVMPAVPGSEADDRADNPAR
jgi:hypothetical protein